MKDIEDEIPFDVPDGWSWCRLGESVVDIADIDHKMPKIIDDGIPFISPLDFTKDGKIDFNNAKKISKEDFDRLSRKVKPKKNDIIFPRYGTIGVLRYIDTDRDFLVSYSCATIVTNKSKTIPMYIFFALQTSLTLEEIEKYKVTTTQSNIGIKSLKQFFLPLPPLSEQQLIVAEIEKIFAQIDLLEQNKTDLQTAIKQAKSKILDLAIHGKLVSQDPNDESASVLLEKIRAEKEAKIAKGELKRDKNDSYIYKGSDNCHYQKNANGSIVNIEDEIPFEVPDGWSWCRLGEITSELGDGIHGTPEYDPNGDYFFVNGNNLCNGKIIIKEDTKRVSITEFNKYKKNLNEKTVFVSINGTLGNVAFYNNESIILGKSACYLNLFKQKFKLYIFALLNSEYFKKYSYENATGSTIKNVSLKSMRDFLIPLPPLTEQTCIVEKIEELFTLLDNIQNNLI